MSDFPSPPPEPRQDVLPLPARREPSAEPGGGRGRKARDEAARLVPPYARAPQSVSFVAGAEPARGRRGDAPPPVPPAPPSAADAAADLDARLVRAPPAFATVRTQTLASPRVRSAHETKK